MMIESYYSIWTILILNDKYCNMMFSSFFSFFFSFFFSSLSSSSSSFFFCFFFFLLSLFGLIYQSINHHFWNVCCVYVIECLIFISIQIRLLIFTQHRNIMVWMMKKLLSFFFFSFFSSSSYFLFIISSFFFGRKYKTSY